MNNVSEYNDNGIDTRTGLPWGETDEMPFLDKVVERMRKLHKEYVDNNGNAPKFADVIVQFNGEGRDSAFESLIKLRDFNPTNTEYDPDDGHVIYYANGIDELCEINTDRTADFVITKIIGFCDSY